MNYTLGEWIPSCFIFFYRHFFFFLWTINFPTVFWYWKQNFTLWRRVTEKIFGTQFYAVHVSCKASNGRHWTRDGTLFDAFWKFCLFQKLWFKNEKIKISKSVSQTTQNFYTSFKFDLYSYLESDCF